MSLAEDLADLDESITETVFNSEIIDEIDSDT